MPIDWKDKSVNDRLLAAIIASYDSSINCREVARLYGKDATYNAIENFLRKPKNFAKELKEQAANRAGPAPSPARPRGVKKTVNGIGSTPTTPTKNGTKSGRVTKPRKASSSPIKKEIFDNELFDSLTIDKNDEADVDPIVEEDDSEYEFAEV